jgi:cytochrome c
MKSLRQASGVFSRLRYWAVIPFLVITMILISFGKRADKPRVLVFSKTKGWHHSSIPNGVAAVRKLGTENNFDVDTTTDASKFDDENLKKYATVVFMSTTGDVLDPREQVAFERYIQAGGGFVGVHSATDTEYDWGWYGRLVGGYFYDHPGIHDTFHNVQSGTFNVVDQNNISTKHLPKQWKRTDEFYSFKKLAPDTKVLITLDESTYGGGKRMGNHPMAWYHEFDGGRAFYTALGHTEESYTDPLYLKHLLGGIEYAIGNNTPLSYSKATSQYAPEEDRFTKTALVEGVFFEPTEMTILPNLNVLVAQRRGEIMMYNNNTKKVKQVGFLNVYWKTSVPGVNAEEGVLGLNKDPNFDKNHWIYIYYSPIDSSVNRLSRFTFKNDTIDLATEKTILEVKSQREICCHTGGSIAFGPDGLLYLSAGDNSTPFNEPKAKYLTNSYAPLNDLPGKMQYDARRSAGNTNDLRGKIMRIRVKDDGTYEIPEGNLFPKGTEKTRPEIYVMGNRNPYRISVDQKNSNLYWGEVGPDANNDSFATRGPRGYDEINQARKAGYFGWPLFVGNNYPYR